MKDVKIFLCQPTRCPEHDLVAALGETALQEIDRILLNNNIDLLIQAGATQIYVDGDENVLDEVFRTEEMLQIFRFLGAREEKSVISQLREKFSQAEDKYFLLLGNSFGLHPGYYASLRNQLEIEEDICVVHSDIHERICGIAAYRLEEALFSFLQEPVNKQQLVFSPNAPDRYYLFTDGLCVVDSLAQFQDLYRQLSHRENVHLCSKYFYDQFTEHFIEFKELLK
jgi:hypothetical protein